MKRILPLFLALLIGQVQAQDSTATDTTYWTTGGVFGISFSQIALSNWQAGGENAVSGIVRLNYEALYKTDKVTWRNNIQTAYGLARIGSDPVIKTDDQISLTSSYGRSLNKNWDVNASLNFRTQYAEGFDAEIDTQLISNFMAPGYLIPSLGFEYHPNKWFYANLSPLTGKLTFVQDQTLADRGQFGVDPGENLRVEVGFMAKVAINKEVAKNIVLETTADFFSNYLVNPANIDVNWNLLLAMKVNDWLTTSIMTSLIYDEDIEVVTERDVEGNPISYGPRVQFKEAFGLGIRIALK